MPPTPGPAPTPLRAAAAVVLVQGLVLVGLAVAEAASLTAGRLGMGATTAAFFASYGLGLLVCARALWSARTWARGPVLLTQLLGLGLAYSFHGGETAALAWLLLATSLLALVGLLHPASLRALAESDG